MNRFKTSRYLARIMAVLLAAVCSAATARPATADIQANAPASTATLPLSEYLALHRLSRPAPDDRDTQAPVPAVLQFVHLDAQLLDDAVNVKARAVVQVLAHDTWVSVPVLEVSRETVLNRLPDIKNATLGIENGELRLITNQRGRYEISLEFLQRAVREQEARTLTLGIATPTFVRCRVRHDRGFFELLGNDFRRDGKHTVIFPAAEGCSIRWKRKAGAVASATEASAPPQAPPVITATHASLVATLEGERVLRVLYQLRFSGARKVRVQLAEGQRLVRLFVNGAASASKRDGDTVSVTVQPREDGRTSATLELVVASSGHNYLLAGQQSFALPKPSWPSNVVHLRVSLPAVFDYRWIAGTLSPVKHAPGIEFTHQIPTPGKQLHFRRHLLSDAFAKVRLDYNVALEGHYYTGRAAR